MPAVKAIVLPVMLALDGAMEPAMLAAAQILMVGSVMDPLKPVVAEIVPILQAVMLTVVPAARAAAVRNGRGRHAKGQNGTDRRQSKFAHLQLLTSDKRAICF